MSHGNKKTLDLQQFIAPEGIAYQIANHYVEWNTYRNKWLDEKRELRNYIFATDTTKTTNSQNPWKNKTTTPKLCQIRDNLMTNYMDALIPNS